MSRVIENVIEWIDGDKYATCTFSSGKFANNVLKLAEKYPDDVKILAKNRDKSVLAKVPLNAVHVSIYKRKNNNIEAINNKE